MGRKKCTLIKSTKMSLCGHFVRTLKSDIHFLNKYSVSAYDSRNFVCQDRVDSDEQDKHGSWLLKAYYVKQSIFKKQEKVINCEQVWDEK